MKEREIAIIVSVTMSPIKITDIFISHSRRDLSQSVTCAPHYFKISVVIRSASGFYLMCS